MKNFSITKLFWAIFGIAAIIILIILFSKGCGNGNERAKELQKQSDAAKARYEAKIKSLDAETSILKDSMETLKQEREAAVSNRQHLSTLLTQSNSKAAQLAHRIKSLTGQDPIVIVEPCDSLATIVLNQEGQINELIAAIEQTDSLLHYEVSIRDEVIELLQRKFVTCDSNYNDEKKRLDKIYSELKPRWQVWAGGEISGSAITPFNQAGIVLSYVPKSGGKRFDIGGGLQVQGGYYVKIGAAFKIRLRR